MSSTRFRTARRLRGDGPSTIIRRAVFDATVFGSCLRRGELSSCLIGVGGCFASRACSRGVLNQSITGRLFP
ncbi:hypothetical protein DIPPA_18598 [Diplonema papillatum]|nr:hypothetical protein DIPPA_18598 [Diplonema papillatum]